MSMFFFYLKGEGLGISSLLFSVLSFKGGTPASDQFQHWKQHQDNN